MPEPHRPPVRPTKRCLDDLQLGFPPLEQQLHTVENPVVAKAQQVPSEVAAHGAERVAALQDLVWFKVKTGVYRAAAHKLDEAKEQRPEVIAGEAWWWLGAAGRRKADSGSEDFYARLEAECRRAGRGSGRVSSLHLLPGDLDTKRLRAELAAQATVRIRTLVCRLVAKSLHDGQVWSAVLGRHEVSAVVRAHDGDAYIAVGANGFVDPNFLAVILRSIPGVGVDDWLPEPGGALGVAPENGQILYSAIIPAEYQSKIVDEYGSGD